MKPRLPPSAAEAAAVTATLRGKLHLEFKNDFRSRPIGSSLLKTFNQHLQITRKIKTKLFLNMHTFFISKYSVCVRKYARDGNV